MAKCPACGRDLLPGAEECHSCGVILAKYRPRPSRPARPRAPRRRTSLARALALGLAGGTAVAGAYYYVAVRPRVERILDPQVQAQPGRSWHAEARRDPVSDFDLELALGASPQGLAWNGRGFLLGNRLDPWGFVEVVPDEDDEIGFTLRRRPVVENRYGQRIGLDAVTWNGEAFVGYTDGGWFQRQGTAVFTLHDPETLEVLSHVAAPPLLGCLAFDGTSYWAATRRNTAHADEEAHLYRLSAELRVMVRYEPPGVGCQGLTWDGERLYFADVFSEDIHVLDVTGTPRVVQSYGTRFDYLSGLAHDGESLWVVEYGDDRLLRLNPRLATAWAARAAAGGVLEPLPLLARRPAGAASASASSGADVEELRQKLRSDDWAERMRAEIELRDRGLPVDFDREDDSFVDGEVGPEEIGVAEWQVELREDTLLASWRIYFGEALFSGRDRATKGPLSLPIFARFTVTVEGGSLAGPVESVFEAEPGENVAQDMELASGLGRGSYRVDLFFHVQYVDPDGGPRILNKSAMSLEVSR